MNQAPLPKEGEKGSDAVDPSEMLSPSRGDYRSDTITLLDPSHLAGN